MGIPCYIGAFNFFLLGEVVLFLIVDYFLRGQDHTTIGVVRVSLGIVFLLYNIFFVFPIVVPLYDELFKNRAVCAGF